MFTIRRYMPNLLDEMIPDWTAFEHEAFPGLILREDEQNLTIEAEVPGMEKDEIEVFLSGNTLTLKAEQKARKKGDAERSFSRTLTLSMDTDPAKAQAHLKNGVLTLTLPKPEAVKPHRIAIEG